MKTKCIIISLLFLFVLLPPVFGGLAGGEHVVGSYALSLQGTQATGNIYETRTYLAAGAGGNAQGSSYQANIGFFGMYTGPAPYTVIINATKIVGAGYVYSLSIEVVNLSSRTVNISSAPKISLYDPCKNLIAGSVDANKISDTLYQYNFTTVLMHVAGAWETNIDVGINGIAKQYSHSWTLSNGHTAVSINSVNASSAPAIKADVTIINEDNLSNEYPYEYCIVSVLTQQCGNPGNVAYGNGYKLLGAGESWNHTFSLDVNQQGSYWFKVLVHYGIQQSGASLSFSAIYTPGGGGITGGIVGGGGGGGAIISTIIVSESYFSSPNGITASLKAYDEFEVTFRPSAAAAPEKHTIKILSVKADSVTVVILTAPITVSLRIGEEQKVDIDLDGIYDIYLKLNDIKNGQASITIKKTSGAVPKGGEIITGEVIKYPEYLMDITIRILDEYKKVRAGEKILAEVDLYNFGTEEIKDANITYCIRDFEGKNVFGCNKETITIYTKIQFIKTLILPQKIDKGLYLLYTTVNYRGGEAVAQADFEVTEEEYAKGLELPSFFMYTLLTIFVSIIAIIILWWIIPIAIRNKEKFAGIFRRITKFREYPPNSILGLMGKKVYTDSGNYIGEVRDFILGKERIDKLKIVLDRQYKFKVKVIIVSYANVKNVGDVMIIDKKLYKYLMNNRRNKISARAPSPQSPGIG